MVKSKYEKVKDGDKKYIKKRNNIANIITSIRILCSIIMIFYPAFSGKFYFLYLTAGFTDMIDGTIARKTNSVSEFGSKLDTFSDLIFVIVCLIKLIPKMNFPVWLYLWIIFIAFIKFTTMTYGYVVRKEFVAVHSIMNKITGILLFIFPLTIPFIEMIYSAIFICIVATASAIQEGIYIINLK